LRNIELSTLTKLASKNAFSAYEFRLTEVKWNMRFWWRAINTFSNVAEMKIKESILFGHQLLYKSPIILKYGNNKNSLQKDPIEEKQTFKLKIFLQNRKIRHNWNRFIEDFEQYRDAKPEDAIFKNTIKQSRNIDFYIRLLELSCILGGIGGDARQNKGILLFKDVSSNRDKLNQAQNSSIKSGNINNSDLASKVMGLLKDLDVNKSYELLNDDGEKTISRKTKYEMDYIEELKLYPYIKGIHFYDRIADKNEAYKGFVSGYKELGKIYFENKKNEKNGDNNEKDGERFIYPFYSTKYKLDEKETGLIVVLNDLVYQEDLKKEEGGV